ncbi:MAG: hypothetical protein ABIJ34_01205 [archaeon]
MQALPKIIETYHAVLVAYDKPVDIDAKKIEEIGKICQSGLDQVLDVLLLGVNLIDETKGKDPTPIQIAKYGFMALIQYFDRTEKQYVAWTEQASCIFGDSRAANVSILKDFSSLEQVARDCLKDYLSRNGFFGIISEDEFDTMGNDNYDSALTAKMKKLLKHAKDHGQEVMPMMRDSILSKTTEMAHKNYVSEAGKFEQNGRELYRIMHSYNEGEEKIRLQVHGFTVPEFDETEFDNYKNLKGYYSQILEPMKQEGIRFPGQLYGSLFDYQMKIDFVEVKSHTDAEQRFLKVQETLDNNFIFMVKKE